MPESARRARGTSEWLTITLTRDWPELGLKAGCQLAPDGSGGVLVYDHLSMESLPPPLREAVALLEKLINRRTFPPESPSESPPRAERRLRIIR